MILAIRSDKPEAELYLYLKNNQVDTFRWKAHRKLADELLLKIEVLLKNNKIKLDELTGIVVFTGDGSFTGLRIGTTIANSLAYSLNIPIIESSGEDWITTGLVSLKTAEPGKYVVPKYSKEPNITKPKN